MPCQRLKIIVNVKVEINFNALLRPPATKRSDVIHLNGEPATSTDMIDIDRRQQEVGVFRDYQ